MTDPTDITPQGSAAPVFLDPTPLDPIAPAPEPAPVPPVVRSPSGTPFAIAVDDEGNIVATPVEPQ